MEITYSELLQKVMEDPQLFQDKIENCSYRWDSLQTCLNTRDYPLYRVMHASEKNMRIEVEQIHSMFDAGRTLRQSNGEINHTFKLILS